MQFEVKGKQRKYEVQIGQHILQNFLFKHSELAEKRIMLLFDAKVYELYGNAVEQLFSELGCAYRHYIAPRGELAKSLDIYADLLSQMAVCSMQRDDMLIVCGGGAVCDLGGFAASCYMRGIDHVLLPSTLLAQADACLGGKCGVNLKQGKNMIGAFYEPIAVCCDTDFLITLNSEDYYDGMAEIIKYAMLGETKIQTLLENNQINRGTEEEMVALALRMKAAFCAEDFYDRGKRRFLNFGHSFAHAIEKRGDFSQFSHGQAVAIGMFLAASFGETLGKTAQGTAKAVAGYCTRYNLPIRLPYALEELFPFMQSDKKGGKTVLSMILLEEIGKPFIYECSWEELWLFCKRGDLFA